MQLSFHLLKFLLIFGNWTISLHRQCLHAVFVRQFPHQWIFFMICDAWHDANIIQSSRHEHISTSLTKLCDGAQMAIFGTAMCSYFGHNTNARCFIHLKVLACNYWHLSNYIKQDNRSRKQLLPNARSFTIPVLETCQSHKYDWLINCVDNLYVAFDFKKYSVKYYSQYVIFICY